MKDDKLSFAVIVTVLSYSYKLHFRYLMPFELYLRSSKRHGKEAFCRILGCVLFDGISFAEYLSATELPLRRKLL